MKIRKNYRFHTLDKTNKNIMLLSFLKELYNTLVFIDFKIQIEDSMNLQ